MSRVALAALVYFGPLTLTVLFLLTHQWLQRRRTHQSRIPVAQLIARIEQERIHQPTDRLPSQAVNLPPAWCWPSRDPDRLPSIEHVKRA